MTILSEEANRLCVSLARLDTAMTTEKIHHLGVFSKGLVQKHHDNVFDRKFAAVIGNWPIHLYVAGKFI